MMTIESVKRAQRALEDAIHDLRSVSAILQDYGVRGVLEDLAVLCAEIHAIKRSLKKLPIDPQSAGRV